MAAHLQRAGHRVLESGQDTAPPGQEQAEAAGRRSGSYNYRVVMHKGDVPLYMRDRAAGVGGHRDSNGAG